MNLDRLEQYKDKLKEIKLLESRIIEMRQEETEIVSDTVRGSSSSFPYTQYTVKITGLNVKKREKINRVIERLIIRKTALYHDLEEVEQFVDEIQDSRVRQIIELRYIKGMSWNAVSTKVYNYPNGDRARKTIKRFFEEM
jgi:hypothetical protein